MYDLIIRAVMGSPWAIMPEKLAAIQALLALRASGGRVDPAEVAAIAGKRKDGAVRSSGAVAVIPVYGTIHQHADLMAESSGGVSTDALSDTFERAMSDPGVSALVLDMDSPGGQTYGVREMADQVFEARGRKPVVAVANSLMASAAYWIGCSADEVWASPGASVGSIGVYIAHKDLSQALDKEGVAVSIISAGKHKVEGNPWQALSDEGRAALQERVDDTYADFVGAVARGRGTSEAKVRSGYGEGRDLLAARAKAAGLVDRIGTLAQAIERAGELAQRRSSARAAALRLRME